MSKKIHIYTPSRAPSIILRLPLNPFPSIQLLQMICHFQLPLVIWLEYSEMGYFCQNHKFILAFCINMLYTLTHGKPCWVLYQSSTDIPVSVLQMFILPDICIMMKLFLLQLQFVSFRICCTFSAASMQQVLFITYLKCILRPPGGGGMPISTLHAVHHRWP